MSIVKSLIGQLQFNLCFNHEKRKIIKDFDNFNQTLILNPNTDWIPKKIPKKIWVYWQGKKCTLVEKCVAKIRSLNPDFEVFFLDQESIKQFSNIPYDNFSNISPQLKSDLIRLDLLNQYGGYWLDASIITFESLEWIQILVEKNRTESFAYYRKKNTTNLKYPVIENWILACPPYTPFFMEWQHEVHKIIEQTAKVYLHNICQQYQEPEQYFQNINMPKYLCPYIAAQLVMRKHLPSMTLINCDKNAFFLQTSFKWNKYKVLRALAIDEKPQSMPQLIKLVGKERNLINRYYERRKYKENSLLSEL